jgi:uncharacterized MnhB-related membrane protein
MLVNSIEIAVAVLLVGLAFFAVNGTSLIKSIMLVSLLSMISVVVFVFLQAPDVAITEAVIGSGLVTSLFVFTLLSNKKGDAK